MKTYFTMCVLCCLHNEVVLLFVSYKKSYPKKKKVIKPVLLPLLLIAITKTWHPVNGFLLAGTCPSLSFK